MDVTASHARTNLYKLLEQVNEQDEIVAIKHKGATVFLVPERELGSLQEMVHLLGSRKNGRRLYDSLDAVERGDVVRMDADSLLERLDHAIEAIEAQTSKSA